MTNFECEHCEGCLYFRYGDECMHHERKARILRVPEALHTEPYCSACADFVPSLECRLTRAAEEISACLDGERRHHDPT